MDEIELCGQTWTIIWTKHAKNRTYDRRSHPAVAAQALIQVLKTLEKIIPNLVDVMHYTTIVRAYPFHSAFRVNIYPETNKIVVVTYGIVTKFYPKEEDFVITLSIAYAATSCIWGYPKDHAKSQYKFWGRLLEGKKENVDET